MMMKREGQEGDRPRSLVVHLWAAATSTTAAYLGLLTSLFGSLLSLSLSLSLSVSLRSKKTATTTTTTKTKNESNGLSAALVFCFFFRCRLLVGVCVG